MRSMIFEYSGGGHRLTYVRQMIAALRGHAGIEIIVALSSSAASGEAFEHQIAPWLDDIELLVLDPRHAGSGRLATARDQVSMLRSAIDRARPQRLIVPTADGLAQLLALRPASLRGVERADLVVHGAGFAHPMSGPPEAIKYKASLALLSLVPNAGIHFVNAFGWDWLSSKGRSLASRSDVLPDPVDAQQPRDRREARLRLALPADDALIVSAGAQDRRKGIHLLLGALAHLPAETLARVRLVLAGKCAPDIAPDLRSLPPHIEQRVIRIDRYLSDEELADALSAADLVATCHPRHMGLSNIALRAASLARPVLASDWGWLGSIVPRFHLGWTGPIHDPPGYARTILQAVQEAPRWHPSDATQALLRFHHPDNFRDHILGWFGIGTGGLTWKQVNQPTNP